MSTHIWLRAESKPAERRTVLPPKHAKQLVESGFQVSVEKSTQSIFDWKDYESNGCQIVDEHSWQTQAPDDAIILGLKELPPSSKPLSHKHIHFAHVYKNQAGWEQFLTRFYAGGGMLYDLEFLLDDSGRRIAAFGHWAGFAGAALSVLAWTNHSLGQNPVLQPIVSRENADSLVAEVKASVRASGKIPKVMVIGALGRCGRGAIELLESVGADVIGWDMEETKQGGPFQEIIDCDIFMNCVFIDTAIPPFIDRELIHRVGRTLSVVCDVSCDPYGNYNPVPIYEQCTTFQDPVSTIIEGTNPLYLIAIDHLPSLLPRESSEDFCDQMLPHLLRLNRLDEGVWKAAGDLFDSRLALAMAKTDQAAGKG